MLAVKDDVGHAEPVADFIPNFVFCSTWSNPAVQSIRLHAFTFGRQ
jgi:hypothetical protein